jgi:YfiH family protein
MIERSFDVPGAGGAGGAGGADGVAGRLRLPLLQSSVIPAGFHHGFTTRRGGIGAAPFDTFNLGMKWGDAAQNVLENRRRLQAASGVARLYFARQVHGANLLRVRADDDPSQVAKAEADGLLSDAPGIAVAVFVADCVPVLMADAGTGAFAAVHAGWRGTLAGVVPAMVRRMRADLGTRPEDLRVALGPAIGVCCFEVGDEVVEAVERVLPDAAKAGAIMRAGEGGARAHVDLKRLNVVLLAREGVPAAAIDAGPECTSCDRERFFSYRRDRGQTGQAAGFIGVSAGA